MDSEKWWTIAGGLVWAALALVILVSYFQVQDFAEDARKPMLWVSMIVMICALLAGLLSKAGRPSP